LAIPGTETNLSHSPKWIDGKEARIFFILIIVISFWFVNCQYQGPAYLQDEIGYLSNASFLAGYRVDGASSYLGGYSIFLAPLFFMIDEPFLIWQAIMALNAFFWGLCFWVLFKIGDLLFPVAAEKTKKIAIVLSALYPTCISMCGYAFPTTLITFFFLLSIYTILNLDLNSRKSIVLHSLCAGFIFWIHMTGLAPVIATIILIGWAGIRQRKYTALIISALVMIGMCVVSHWFFNPYLVREMTPSGFASLRHYPDTGNLIASVLSINFLFNVLLRVGGQLSCLVASTFGLSMVGFYFVVKSILFYIQDVKAGDENTNNGTDNRIKRGFAYVILCIIGVTTMGGLLFAFRGIGRIDTWLYSRYAEPFGFIFLFIGLFRILENAVDLKVKKMVACFSFFLLTTTGAGIEWVRSSSDNVVNFINLQAFWPLPLISVLGLKFSMISLMLLAAFGVVLVLYMPRKTGYIFMLVIWIYMSLIQIDWHNLLYDQVATPSSFDEFIQNRHKRKRLIAVDPVVYNEFLEDKRTKEWQRLQMYSFYLYNYDYRRMTPEYWKTVSGSKMYITRDITSFVRRSQISKASVSKVMSSGSRNKTCLTDDSWVILSKEKGANLYLVGSYDIKRPDKAEKLKWDFDVIWF